MLGTRAMMNALQKDKKGEKHSCICIIRKLTICDNEVGEPMQTYLFLKRQSTTYRNTPKVFYIIEQIFLDIKRVRHNATAAVGDEEQFNTAAVNIWMSTSENSGDKRVEFCFL